MCALYNCILSTVGDTNNQIVELVHLQLQHTQVETTVLYTAVYSPAVADNNKQTMLELVQKQLWKFLCRCSTCLR